MLIIPIKDGENIDRALKRFKRKFDKTGAMRQLRSSKAVCKAFCKKSSKNSKSAIHSASYEIVKTFRSLSNFTIQRYLNEVL